MAITFRQVVAGRLSGFSATVPDNAVIGIIGENDSGQYQLLRLAAGAMAPEAGEVTANEPRRFLSPSDSLEFDGAQTLSLYHTLALHGALVRSRAALDMEKLRRAGAAILLASHEPELIRWLCDEVWWLRDGHLAGRGDPRTVLDQYQRFVAESLRRQAPSSCALPPSIRQGDGRARLIALDTLGPDGNPTSVWQSGSEAGIRVAVSFEQDVADPVIGILIRTRIGVDVYGTNTELENIKFGPCKAGDRIHITFWMPCHLCPHEYTITAASHDPDGVWHDWMEEALAVSVTDTRYTAGFANLRARVELVR